MEKRNLVMHQALMKLFNEGTFELKAREVPTFLEVYKWANEIPKLIKKDDEEKNKPKSSIEPKPNKVKKVRKKVGK